MGKIKIPSHNTPKLHSMTHVVEKINTYGPS